MLGVGLGITAWHILRYQSASYQYDANGNRSRALYQWPRQNTAGHNQLERQLSLPSGSNRIQALTQSQTIEGQSSTTLRNFEWDAAGQLLSDGDKQHQYNPQGRKASSQAPEPSGTGSQTLHTHYLYNGHSQRVRKASPLGHTDYSYGPAELGMNHWPLGIYRSSGSTQASTEILYLPTPQGPMPVAAEIDGQLYAIETDHLHTPRRLSNAQGQGVWQWITSGFGEVPASHAGNGFVLEGDGSSSGPSLGSSIDFALRYPGQVHDVETGLHYNHHRYYDPQLTVGYTQADPIGLEGGWNRFGYVDGNPLSGIDPDGLQGRYGERERYTREREVRPPPPPPGPRHPPSPVEICAEACYQRDAPMCLLGAFAICSNCAALSPVFGLACGVGCGCALGYLCSEVRNNCYERCRRTNGAQPPIFQ